MRLRKVGGGEVTRHLTPGESTDPNRRVLENKIATPAYTEWVCKDGATPYHPHCDEIRRVIVFLLLLGLLTEYRSHVPQLCVLKVIEEGAHASVCAVGGSRHLAKVQTVIYLFLCSGNNNRH